MKNNEIPQNLYLQAQQVVLKHWIDTAPECYIYDIYNFTSEHFKDYEDIFRAIVSLNESGDKITAVSIGNKINNLIRGSETLSFSEMLSLTESVYVIRAKYIQDEKEKLRNQERAGDISAKQYAEKVESLESGFYISSWKKREVKEDELNTPDPPALITRGENDILCRGQVVKISGHSGNKKSFFALTLAGAALNRGKYIDRTLGFSSLDEELKVLYLDSELPAKTYKSRLKTLKLIIQSNTLPENLHYLALSGLSVEEKLQNANDAIREIKPDIVIYDSIRDFASDYNDNKEATTIKDYLKGIAKNHNLGVIVTMHLNDNSEENKGHLGKTIKDFCDIGFLLVKDELDKEVTKVTYDKLRNDAPAELYFKYDTNLHYLSLYEPLKDNSKEREKKAKAQKLFEDIFKDKEELGHNALVREMVHKGEFKDTKAKELIQTYTGVIIQKKANGNYALIKHSQEDNDDLPLPY